MRTSVLLLSVACAAFAQSHLQPDVRRDPAQSVERMRRSFPPEVFVQPLTLPLPRRPALRFGEPQRQQTPPAFPPDLRQFIQRRLYPGTAPKAVAQPR